MELLEPVSSRKQLSGHVLWFLLWLGVTIVAAFLTPAVHGHGTHQQLGLPPCPSVLLFDRPCPGCGMTTSWAALVKGNIAGAFQAHALGPILYLGFAASAGICLFGFVKRCRFRTEARPIERVLVATAVAIIGYGALRMALSPGFGSADEKALSALAKTQ